MGINKFVYQSRLAAPSEEVFSWFEAPGAFERLSPSWIDVKVLERQGGIKEGRVLLSVAKGPVLVNWVLQHDQYIPGRQFRDYQLKGPFKSWSQLHRVEPDGDDASFLIDTIEYELPDALPAKFAAKLYIESELRKLFSFRHRLIAQDLKQKASYRGGTKMKVLVSGSTGLIGEGLTAFLSSQGHSVVRLVRPESHSDSKDGLKLPSVEWDPKAGKIDIAALEGFDAVVHLGGESIAEGRWSAARKEALRLSRVKGTAFLSDTLARLKNPPKVLVVASAIGYYGDRGPEVLNEQSSKGSGFLSDLCQEWETACQPAARAGIRVVNLRIGVVLSTKGGALTKMLLPFELGAGGEIGSGNQFLSWVSLDDVLGAILHALNTESISGPVNVTAPNPVTNKEFTKTLGKVLSRPTLIPIPTFGLRILFGEMADECLVAGQNVLPTKLHSSNYEFRNKELEPTLRRILGK